ncbi:hypothetical protein ABK040_000753 [Willaertia magna]
MGTTSSRSKTTDFLESGANDDDDIDNSQYSLPVNYKGYYYLYIYENYCFNQFKKLVQIPFIDIMKSKYPFENLLYGNVFPYARNIGINKFEEFHFLHPTDSNSTMHIDVICKEKKNFIKSFKSKQKVTSQQQQESPNSSTKDQLLHNSSESNNNNSGSSIKEGESSKDDDNLIIFIAVVSDLVEKKKRLLFLDQAVKYYSEEDTENDFKDKICQLVYQIQEKE